MKLGDFLKSFRKTESEPASEQEDIKQGRGIKILYQFLLVTLAVSVLPLLASSYKLMDISRTYLEDELLALHSQVANAAAGEISSTMTNVLSNLELVAKAQGGASPLSREVRDRSLIFYLDQYPEIKRLTQYSTNGGEIARAYRVGQSKLPGIDQNVKAIAIKEASGGKTYISSPVVLSTEQIPIIAVGMPIYASDGTIRSILLGVISLNRVQETIQRINIRRQGIAYVVDGGGVLIAHQAVERVAESEDMSSVEIVGKYLLAGVSAGTIPYRDKMGKDMVGSYSTVKGLGWGVVVQEPRSDAYEIIRKMSFQTVIWALVAAMAAGIASTILAIRLASPIGILAEKVMSLAKGDFHQRVDIRSRNELGQLAATFNHMASRIEKHDRNMRELFINTTKALAAAIDAKDPYTRGHSQRVAQITLEISRELGLSPAEQQKVNIAALLHDVGKIGIEDRILRKPTELTDEEYNIIRQHPVWGSMIMGHIKQLKEIIPGIESHHERLDGTGYPKGLKGAQIPLLGRIIAVADTFDAMTSARLYQKAMEPEFVVSKLVEWKGSRYDPEIVDAMIKVLPRISGG